MNDQNFMIEFAKYLATKGLSDESIKVYLRYYKHFNKGLDSDELNQSYINQFLIQHSSNATRSFLNNLFEFLGIDDFKVPRLTGKKKHVERRSLSPQEIEVLRKWLYNNLDEKFLLCFDISYACGLRRSELMNIKVKDFELKTWAENPKNSCKLLIHGKFNRERIVPIKSSLMLRIVDHIENYSMNPDDKIFDFSYKTWDKAFKRAVKNTMDYNYTLHDIRRSRATEWLRNGIDLIRVKHRLGHTSVQTTQLYINLDKEKEYEKWAND